MTKFILALVGLLGLAIGGWIWLKDPPGATTAAATSAARKVEATADARADHSGGYIPAVATATASPRASPGASSAPKPSTVQLIGPAGQLARGEYRALYDKYAANPQGADAETKYYAAVAIEACAGRISKDPEKARKDYEDRIQPGDPTRDQRIAAYDRRFALCKEFVNAGVLPNSTQLLREAAAAGNVNARLALIPEEARRAAAAPPTPNQTAAQRSDRWKLTEDQLATVRDALKGGDPSTIARVGQLLSETQDVATRFSNTNTVPTTLQSQHSATRAAWQLAACDRGANCGSDAIELLNRCTWGGQCGMTSVQQNLQVNELSPTGFLLAQQHSVLVLDAIQNQRWDVLGIAPGMGRTTPLPAATAPAKPANPAPAKPAAKG